MSNKTTHWLYPIHAGTGHWFEDKDGNPILDATTGLNDTSTSAFWVSVQERDAAHWYLSTGYRLIKRDDLVWVYAGAPDQAIVGLGRAVAVDFDEGEDYWYVDIEWDREACAVLKHQPIPRTLFGDIPQTPAIRPSDKARAVLERWLKKHDLDSRLKPSDDLLATLDEEDARLRVLSEVVRRQGQPEFHLDLVIAYNGKCAISGCDVPQALEAAHIRPYNGPNTNLITNGILLRADLHALFDRHLLEIDDKYHVMLHPSLRKGYYKKVHGKRMRLPTPKSARPSKKLLKRHRAQATF